MDKPDALLFHPMSHRMPLFQPANVPRQHCLPQCVRPCGITRRPIQLPCAQSTASVTVAEIVWEGVKPNASVHQSPGHARFVDTRHACLFTAIFLLPCKCGADANRKLERAQTLRLFPRALLNREGDAIDSALFTTIFSGG